MGVDFSISEGGAISIDPIRTRDAFTKMTAMPFEPEKGCHFVGEVLSRLRLQLAGTDATVLGFVGLPFTLGTYLIEGATGTKTGFAAMRGLRESDPQLTKDMLSLVADRIAQYAIYQIDSGAQVRAPTQRWPAGALKGRRRYEACTRRAPAGRGRPVWTVHRPLRLVRVCARGCFGVHLSVAPGAENASRLPTAHPPRTRR